MVSGDRNCIVDGVSTIDYTSSLSHCNVLSLDLNTPSTSNVLHASVDSPCISCNSCLTNLMMICFLCLVAMKPMLPYPLLLV